jgi:hypothetical protein
MHIEALEEILSKANKVLMSKGADSGVLPFLPLRGVQTASTPDRAHSEKIPATGERGESPKRDAGLGGFIETQPDSRKAR